MIYLSLFFAVLALYAWERRSFELRLDRERDSARAREDELLNRIQAPAVAVARSLPPDEGPGFISSFDDEALAQLEEDRTRLRLAE